MMISAPVCVTCGTQFPPAGELPPICPICADERQYIPEAGQRWTDMAALREGYRARIEDDAGVTGLGMTPSFAIGQRALVVRTDEFDVLWDCISLIDDDVIASLSGVRAIAISHPHYYTAMVELSERLGNVPVYLHADDRRWVQRRSPALVFWDGERLELHRDLTLVRCGGHFRGASVLHWHRPQGDVLLSGDTIQVVQTRRDVSFMYSYPNLIPLNRTAVLRIRDSLSGLDFDHIYGAWWGRNVIGGARRVFDMSVERYLRAIGAPSG